MSTFTDEKTGAVKYSLDISFRGMESEPKIQEFHDKMHSIDEMLIKEGVAHSKEWFGKKMSKEVIQEFYRPLVKPSKDPEKYAPTMKFKIPQILSFFLSPGLKKLRANFLLESKARG